MAFLAPHFEPDVFVSYSHGDPKGVGNSPLKVWTHALIQKLESQILSLDTEFDELRIWMDKDIDPTAHLTDQLRAKVSASGILFIVMSKRYLGSSWCTDEREWFRKQIEDRAGDQGRVFVLRVQPTQTQAWPDFLRDERGHAMPGFSFYDPNSEYPRGWINPDEPEFVKELCRLQTALIKRLHELRDRANKRAQAEAAAHRTAPIQPPLGQRRVYLHASADAAPARDDIGGLLSRDGITPITAPEGTAGGIATWQQDGGLRMKMAKRCEAMALLRADDDGERFTADVLEIGVDERDRIGDERGASLPCAVLDKTGAGLPLDLADWDIAHFDVTRDAWRGAFKEWLDANRARPASAP